MDREGRGAPGRRACTSSRTGTRRAARSTAYENVSLYGLVLVARRKVSFGRIDPAQARARSSSRARWSPASSRRRIPFWAAQPQARARGRGSRAPRAPPRRAGGRPRDLRLVRTRAFPRMCATRAPSTPGTARPSKARPEAPLPRARPTSCATARSRSPRSSSRARCRWARRRSRSPTASSPGHPLDGVTMNVPLALLNQVDDAARGLARAGHGPRQGGVDDEGAAQAHPHAARARCPST